MCSPMHWLCNPFITEQKKCISVGSKCSTQGLSKVLTIKSTVARVSGILVNVSFILANSVSCNDATFRRCKGPVKFFSKLNNLFVGYFHPINIFLDNKNKYFSG